MKTYFRYSPSPERFGFGIIKTGARSTLAIKKNKTRHFSNCYNGVMATRFIHLEQFWCKTEKQNESYMWYGEVSIGSFKPKMLKKPAEFLTLSESRLAGE